MFAFEHEALRQTLWGYDFANPVGLAAGFDKNARLVRFWQRLGFGFAEVGSVSARRSKGNPRPRAFRLPADEALINRMGLNNDGARRVARRLRRARRRGFPLGVNLAKTHDPTLTGEAAVEDFRTSFRLLAPLADYVALNISCPNTAEGKTFEDPNALDDLLHAVFAERAALALTVPVLVKLSPPLSERFVFDSLFDELLAVAGAHGVHGFIAANTAPDRDGLSTPAEHLNAIGPGGLSGAPLERRATRLVRYLFRKTGGACPIIGTGGVRSAETAYAKIRAGASLVQLYTGLVYEGPGLVRRIKEGLVALLERDGFTHVGEAVGVDA
ncbi:MAG: dihydroorotate dehydrogenase 2 [Rhodothermaceae bacterium]|nr:MAG: dihydroorotate dehydrogenase 2 [Rhodothermaceae bacterium]